MVLLLSEDMCAQNDFFLGLKVPKVQNREKDMRKKQTKIQGDGEAERKTLNAQISRAKKKETRGSTTKAWKQHRKFVNFDCNHKNYFSFKVKLSL